MSKVDRELLGEMGFSKSTNEAGWGHEVWYHPVDFWVHFDSPREKCYPVHSLNAETESRGEFLARFLTKLEQHFIDSAYVHYEPFYTN